MGRTSPPPFSGWTRHSSRSSGIPASSGCCVRQQVAVPNTGHVHVAVSGYGKRIVPAATPFEYARAEDDTLLATATWGDSPHTRRITTDAPSDRGMDDPIATVIDGPARREWWIDTGNVYSVPLPRGWTVIATGELSPAFYL